MVLCVWFSDFFSPTVLLSVPLPRLFIANVQMGSLPPVPVRFKKSEKLSPKIPHKN